MKTGLSDNLDQPVSQEILLLYLAALQKEGQKDELWLNKLLAKDPNAAEKLKQYENLR